MPNQVALSGTVYLHFGTSSASTGAAANADSTPTVVVAKDGTDLGYAPTVTNVATGLYKVAIACTAGNGFAAGSRFSAYVTATVGGITGRDGLGEFEVIATDLNTGVASVQGNVTGSVASVTGAVGSVTGLTAANLDVAVSTRMATFTLPTNFSAFAITAGGAVTAGTVSDKTGYSLTQSFPANFSALAITAGGIASADIKYVNAVLVNGAGTGGNPWGP